MHLVLIAIGLMLLIIGCLYVYKRNVIIRMNAYMRNKILNDMHVLTNHRKIGVLFILVSLLFLYFGFILLR